MAIPAITIRRHIKAPVEAVFHAWTAPEAMMKWFSPSSEMAVPLAQSELKVGGRYRLIMREKSGEEYRVGGSYREIVPNRRLVFTWAWESTPEHMSLVTVDFEPDGKGTQLTVKHEMFADQQARDQHERGWTGCLGRLTALLEPASTT